MRFSSSSRDQSPAPTLSTASSEIVEARSHRGVRSSRARLPLLLGTTRLMGAAVLIGAAVLMAAGLVATPANAQETKDTNNSAQGSAAANGTQAGEGSSSESASNKSQLSEEERLAQAKRKFGRALELEVAKDFTGALRLYREVGLVKMTPQVRYHIALCEEQLGNLVAALGGYHIALDQSAGMHPDFINEVTQSIEDLKARIPKIVLSRGAGAEAAIVQLDGVELGNSQFGAELPVDPGPHSIIAKAPGRETLDTTLKAQEGSVARLEIKLKTPPKPVAPVEEQGPRGYGKLPFFVGGAGLLIAGGGGALLGLSQVKVNEINETCNGQTDCSAAINGDAVLYNRLTKLDRQARTFETVGWVGIGVGAGALVAGTVLFIIDPARKQKRQKKKESALRFIPAAPKSDWGFSLQANF